MVGPTSFSRCKPRRIAVITSTRSIFPVVGIGILLVLTLRLCPVRSIREPLHGRRPNTTERLHPKRTRRQIASALFGEGVHTGHYEGAGARRPHRSQGERSVSDRPER